MIRLPTLAALLISLPTLGPWQPPSPEPGDAKTWVGRYQEMEDYLRTAECVSIVASAPDSAARCTFRPGGPVARMAWRSLPPGVHRGFRQSYKSEIAAYELDKLLKMDMVPPSVERRLKGNTGAAQQWVENVVDATDPAVPSGADRTHWDDQLVRMAMFDNLIGNRERNRRNMLRDAEWNLILIDHSRAFGTDTGLHHKMSRIDAAYWAKIEGLTRNQLDAALHGWLDQPEIQAILDRRETMRGEIRLLPK